MKPRNVIGNAQKLRTTMIFNQTTYERKGRKQNLRRLK